MSNMPQPVPRLLRLREVLALIPIKRASVYRAVREGRFPRPCKLLGVLNNGRASAWSESEITDWISARLAERNEAKR